MLKWFLYALALILGLAFFLPTSGSTEIRNLPLLLAILGLVLIYWLYRSILLLVLAQKIKYALRQKGLEVRRTRLLFGKGYVVAENAEETVDVYFLLLKRKYYRYHFVNPTLVEQWKTTFSVARSSKRGTVARGAADTRMVGRQNLSWRQFVEERKVQRFIVMNKLPDGISDAANREMPGEGDRICNSDVTLWSLEGFQKEMQDTE